MWRSTIKLTDKQLTRAIYSTWDFQQALSALTFLLEDCDFTKKCNKIELRRFRCYETTFIISLARSFTQSRNASILNLKVLNIKLSAKEKKLLDEIKYLRKKVIAHSDEDEMHFRSNIISIFEDEFKIPYFQFNEGLSFSKKELQALETMLLRLRQKMAEFFVKLSQENPKALEMYKEPQRFQ